MSQMKTVRRDTPGARAKFGAALMLGDDAALRALGMVMLRYCTIAFVIGAIVGGLLFWWWFA